MELEKKFREMIQKMKAYIYVLQLTGWDSNTEAPRGSFRRRAEVLGVLSRELFSLGVSKEYQDVVNELFSKLETLDDNLKREVKKAKKSLDKIINILNAFD